MKATYAAIAMIIAGSLWSPISDAVEPSELDRLKTGVTSYEQIHSWWGSGKLVGRSGQHCGAIRSHYELGNEQKLEVSWDRGIVCAWRVLSADSDSAVDVAAASASGRRE